MNAARRIIPAVLLAASALPLAGCITVEVKPIYATLDINLRVKIERELDDVFSYEKDLRKPAGATAPSSKADAKPEGAQS